LSTVALGSASAFWHLARNASEAGAHLSSCGWCWCDGGLRHFGLDAAWHGGAGPGARLAGAGLALLEESLVLLVLLASGWVCAGAGFTNHATSVEEHGVVWAVATFNAWCGTGLGWYFTIHCLAEIGAGSWAGCAASFVNHTALACLWADVWSPPADVDSLGVTGVGVGGDSGAQGIAV